MSLPPTVPGDKVNLKAPGDKPGPKLPSRVGTPTLQQRGKPGSQQKGANESITNNHKASNIFTSPQTATSKGNTTAHFSTGGADSRARFRDQDHESSSEQVSASQSGPNFGGKVKA